MVCACQLSFVIYLMMLNPTCDACVCVLLHDRFSVHPADGRVRDIHMRSYRVLTRLVTVRRYVMKLLIVSEYSDSFRRSIVTSPLLA